jgi:hypothetical protein
LKKRRKTETVATSNFDYRTREEHESRLRTIVLHSADALPARVAEYIRAASEEGRSRAREQILKTFVPLVDHLPVQFVDFALRQMVLPPEHRDWTWERPGKLGINTPLDYHAPAHVQGPFLRLLRTNEDEGLRLVHGLTNAATLNWRYSEQAGGSPFGVRTPLPVVLRLAAGPKELWGIEEVYCWFRHTSVGPYAVISALMALEVWMEEQVAAGRDGGELIAKVMAGSESVAVLGVCIAIALGTSGQCLPAVLPYIAHPLVWRMDIHRFGNDRRGPPIIDLFGQHEHINEQLRERNERPQRRLKIWNLIAHCVNQENDAVRAAFQQAFANFGDELPFQFEEEKGREDVAQALRAEIEDYRGLLDRGNYHHVQTEHASGWHYDPPREPTQEEQHRFEKALKSNEYAGAAIWANTALESSKPPDPGEMARMVGAAKSYWRAEDFSREVEPDSKPGASGQQSVPETSIYPPDWCLDAGGPESIRGQAIVAVAAAVTAKAWAWAQQHQHSDWCKSVLLAAARCLPNRFDAANRRNVFWLDPKLNAAKGLTALVTQGAADAEVRQTVLGLVLDPQIQVVQAVFAGLGGAWARDGALCWNCLSLAISIAVVPGGSVVPGMGLTFNETGIARLERMWELHAGSLERGEKPQLPPVEGDERGFFLWDLVARALQGLPVAELASQPDSKTAFLRLADNLMTWTVSENLRGSEVDRRPRRHSEALWEWNHFFFGWLADLARHLTPDDAERHVLVPVLAAQPRLPRLAADLLHGLIQFQIARLPPQEPPEPKAVRTWERVCHELLGWSEIARWADGEYLSGDWSDAVTMMVFVGHGMYLLKDEWSHVPAFAGVIGKWLEVVGTNHEAYRAFLTMLKAAYRHFPSAQVVGWLHRVASRSEDMKALWQSGNSGERTARVLHGVWRVARVELTTDRPAFRQFSELVDGLAASGVTIASVIQQHLEGINAG